MVILTEAIAELISKQAEAAYPDECCGLLLGKLEVGWSGESGRTAYKAGQRTVTQIMAIANAREEDARHNRFLITPDDMLHGELTARKANLAVLGFYHSHPDHPAAPSAYDLEHAWPFYSYIILAVSKGQAQQMTSWLLAEDRAEFQAEQVRIAAKAVAIKKGD